MKLLPLGSTLLALISTALLSAGCPDTSPTSPPDVTGVVFIDADGNHPALSFVDYSTRDSNAAATAADAGEDTPQVPADANIAFTFAQLLKGTTIETPIPKKQVIDGKEVEIRVGKGDWENQIPVIDHFEPVAGVIESSIPFAASYAPYGAWFLDPAARIDQNPPPAVELQAVDAAGEAVPMAPGVVVIHLMSDGGLKGMSDKNIAPAKNSKGEPIVLPDGRKVAATVIFQVAPPPAEG